MSGHGIHKKSASVLYKNAFAVKRFCMRILRACPLFITLITAMTLPAETPSTPSYETRETIPAQFKWDFSLFYPDWDAWKADMVRMEALYEEMATYQGRLAEGPQTLITVLNLSSEAGLLGTKVWGYLSARRDVDMRENEPQQRYRELLAVYARIGPKLSWISPEILTIPQETMLEWVDAHPELEPHRFGLMDTYRTGEFTLDAEGERLLSLHSRVRGTARDIYQTLTGADVERPDVRLSNEETLELSAGVYAKALNVYENPADRRTVQEAWMEQFKERRNTFASIYNGVLNQGWALAQSRGYESTLAMELNGNDIPHAVVESLVETARSGSAEVQRYHHLRQRLMGLERYGWSDMHMTLLPSKETYPYEQAVPLIVDAVAILGEEYTLKMREQFTAGYVDVYETPGKRSGAYNSGSYGVGSFVLLNYQGTLEDVFTVAHEMGHSMHTRLAHDYQPYPTHRYTIFVAEVASTLTEKLLLRQLLETIDDPRERIAFIEQQLEAIHGTFFLQTMMADFEIQAHALVETGEGITAERLTELWKSTVQAYFGDVIPEDDPYMYSWARIPHLYNSPYYVYQYATSLAASASLMKRMEERPEETVERYLELLKSGGNDYPMNQLKKAGVDLTDKEVLHAVVEEFAALVDLLEEEFSRYLDSQKSFG